MTSKKIFKPRPSYGWMWVGALGLMLLTIGLGMLVTYGFKGRYILTILLTIPLGLIFLVVALGFPSMRYEIDGSRLILTYSPLLRYNIEIPQIKSIRRSDLKISPVSSFRFPGLAIFSVPYLEIGTVKMCATAASTGILLIETESAKYGLTPAREAEFVAELRERMRE
ncbi:MAG TPA: PH domain-containing protein [Anaerolineales bacterium]|nr:PH domain-containing protein [Anaerolineales bacterium]